MLQMTVFGLQGRPVHACKGVFRTAGGTISLYALFARRDLC